MTKSTKKISTFKAQKIAKILFGLDLSIPTIIKLTKENKIAIQISGKFSRWTVDEARWIEFLKEKLCPEQPLKNQQLTPFKTD